MRDRLARRAGGARAAAVGARAQRRAAARGAQRRGQDRRAAHGRAGRGGGRPGRRVPLAPRLSVQPVLGYDADQRRARAARPARLEPAQQPLLDEAVIAAGGLPEGVSTKPRVKLARGTRTDAAAGEVLTRLREIAEVNVPGTLADLDTEFLHDLRVSIRRARSVLRELKHVHDPAARASCATSSSGRSSSPAPCATSTCSCSSGAISSGCSPAERAPELEPLRALLARRRARELTKLRARPARQALRRRARRVAHAAGADEDGADAARPIEAVAGQRIRKVYRRMVRDGSRIDDEQPARGAARPAQARQGAALPARAVRQPVPEERGQADGQHAQGPPGGARALPGPRRPDRAAARAARRARGRAAAAPPR